MKHLKTYESIREPQIGDYVICKEEDYDDLNEFLLNNIGTIYDKKGCDRFYVTYENIPLSLYNRYQFDFNNIKNCRFYGPKEIIHFSPNKEYLETFIQAKKYNL